MGLWVGACGDDTVVFGKALLARLQQVKLWGWQTGGIRVDRGLGGSLRLAAVVGVRCCPGCGLEGGGRGVAGARDGSGAAAGLGELLAARSCPCPSSSLGPPPPLQLAEGSQAARELLALSLLINQAVGDAISGILLVEAALRRRGWGLADWAALYTDLPSRQLKVRVADRGAIQTSHAETRVAAPQGLQPLIDAAVAGVPSGRAFVRPSGTEDVVRVYAEAETRGAADALAASVAALVHEHAGGIGERP